MRKTEYVIPERCQNCQIIFLVGGAAHDWKEEARNRGVKRLSMLGENDVKSADGVWLGDLISPDEDVCPKCGTRIGVPIEVEWPEHCGLCESAPSVFWQTTETENIGLCHPCYRKAEGQKWVDMMLERSKRTPRQGN